MNRRLIRGYSLIVRAGRYVKRMHLKDVIIRLQLLRNKFSYQ